MNAPPAPKGSRKEALTSLAIEMMQSRGFSALGLRELADAAQMRAPSLYSHFASKDELSRAAMSLYAERHRAELHHLEALATGAARIRVYVDRCATCIQEEGRLCLFLMLTTNRQDLSEEAVGELTRLVDEQAEWLSAMWEAGRADGSIRSGQTGKNVGPLIFSALRGLMAFAVLQPDPTAAYHAQSDALLAALGVS
ncbi:TetR/AcrR family transcriptional regulator [Aquabacter sp. CN5-332]|uniref:TetR/AcrR family transcriptional regulator n=1 Tax=Aquabacter sp. CN5-332 TaxID=3156608 RepID=UPI0032B57930